MFYYVGHDVEFSTMKVGIEGFDSKTSAEGFSDHTENFVLHKQNHLFP